MDTEVERVVEIAKKNDEFRRGYSFTVTRGIEAMPNMLEVIDRVKAFNDFTEDNDPYGEHDFGSLLCSSETIYWKIDYYNPELSGWCDPLDIRCRRILTIMLAEEY